MQSNSFLKHEIVSRCEELNIKHAISNQTFKENFNIIKRELNKPASDSSVQLFQKFYSKKKMVSVENSEVTHLERKRKPQKLAKINQNLKRRDSITLNGR